MGLIARFFGDSKPPEPPLSRMHSQAASEGLSQQNAITFQGTTRRELLRVVLRDTLNRSGIPSTWIGAEVLTTTSRSNERGVHWRLVIKHWDPRLLACSVAIQRELIRRVTGFDPLASTWLNGISWQIAIEDESPCPPLPHPGSWTQVPPDPAPAQSRAQPPDVPSGDIIQGPVRISGVTDDMARDADAARADLEQLLAVRDADFRDHANGKPTWDPTEPVRL